jgi:hypothetical protein
MNKTIVETCEKPAPAQDRVARLGQPLALAVILIALYILTPRYWESSGESWKHWMYARLLRQTHEFPPLAYSLYVAYLRLFLSLNLVFPWSVKLEFLATRLFASFALYRMLCDYCRRPWALLLACAWIPSISMVEGGNVVLGMGFLALYLSRPKRSPGREEEFIPVSLAAAALCHAAYQFFLIGHLIGAFLDRLKRGTPSAIPAWDGSRSGIAKTAAKIGLAVFAVIALSFHHPAKDAAGNPSLSAESSVTNVFFMIGTWREITRGEPVPSPEVLRDWESYHDAVWGRGVNTIWKAALNRPRIVLANIGSNVPDTLQTPMVFFTGYVPSAFLPLVCVFALLGAAGFMGLLARFADEDRLGRLTATLLGTAGTLAGLLLTWPKFRYTAVLLPVGLLLVAHLEYGAQRLKTFLSRLNRNLALRLCLILCAVLPLAALALNERTCALLLHKAAVSASARLNIRSLEVMLLLGGLAAWAAAARLRRALDKPGRPAAPPNRSHANAIVLGSALCVLATAGFPHGRLAQIKAVWSGQPLLQADEPSAVATYREVLRAVGTHTRIMGFQDHYINGFTDVNLDNTADIFSLPPYPDPSGKTESQLRRLDQIWVGGETELATDVAPQSYARYRLRVEPFLKKMLAQGWTQRQVAWWTVYEAPAEHEPRP